VCFLKEKASLLRAGSLQQHPSQPVLALETPALIQAKSSPERGEAVSSTVAQE